VRYWINTVARDHLQNGIDGGFTQAQHGKATGLRRLSRGDLIAFYAPRTVFRGGEPLQRFLAIAKVTDDAPYQVEMSPDFHPWRRNVRFLPCRDADAASLVPGLTFIRDKRRWGFPFRRGLFEIDAADFHRIAAAMDASID
jgi:hypothetical protein